VFIICLYSHIKLSLFNSGIYYCKCFVAFDFLQLCNILVQFFIFHLLESDFSQSHRLSTLKSANSFYVFMLI
jgi:hypothetical protein